MKREKCSYLSINMGVFALNLCLSKEEGYDSVAWTARGDMTVQELHEHLRSLVVSHGVVNK